MSAEQSTSGLGISTSQTGRNYNEEYSWEMHEKMWYMGGKRQLGFSKGSSALKKSTENEQTKRRNSMWITDVFDKSYLKISEALEENM